MKGPKTQTQRAFVRPQHLSRLFADSSADAWTPVHRLGSELDDLRPVLVVPEAAVKGCKHYDFWRSEEGHLVLRICRDCGAYAVNTLQRGRWQRPRLLRVVRSTR